MLILNRKVGEEILIGGEEIRVMVTRIQGDAVKLGISAPDGVSILRGELVREQAHEHEHRQRKHGGFEGPDPLDPTEDPRFRG